MSNRYNRSISLCVSVSLLTALLAVFLWSGSALAKTRDLSRGQTVYVPAYSHIYQGSLNRPFNLTVLLSIRNVSPDHSLTVTTVEYYDDAGGLIRAVPGTPFEIQPMATFEYLVSESDDTGGSGANFIVTWESEARMAPALLETVMISTRSSQGISFRCPGVVIQERE